MKLSELAREQGADFDYQKVVFDYAWHPDQALPIPARHPVVVVGAGPVGLCLAIDLAQRGVPVVLLDNDCRLSAGSRAVCFAKRTLEVFDRLGCGDRIAKKGVSWNIGRVFLRDEELYHFNLLPESGHERPAFVNLQQYYVEGYLTERVAKLPLIDLRWRHAVTDLQQNSIGVWLTIDTPDGPYRLQADHVIACDGSRSTVRKCMGLESKGRTFRDRFLIADIRMKFDAPAERWFWFDPAFHPNQSVLLHRQPDDVWRIDFQLGWDADPEEEKKPERILPRVKAMLAHSEMKDVPFELVWASVYTFSCLRMDRFQHGRVLFAGDSAHGVSPFGARGANSGVQDADNLAWKLAAVIAGAAPESLLSSYADEREYAADENIRNSTRATDFITPKSDVSRLFRDAVLQLAKSCAFARTLVNTGRLSTPATLALSPLNTPDSDDFSGRMAPGTPAADAPVVLANGERSWLLRELGSGFTLLSAAADVRSLSDVDGRGLPIRTLRVQGDSPDLVDVDGVIGDRYDMQPGTVYLLRPDQHVCARWRNPSTAQINQAIRRALGAE